MFLDPHKLQQALLDRTISPEEIDRAYQLLMEPDPACILSGVTRMQVEHVAVYLHGLVGSLWLPHPMWHVIAGGHPAARAVFAMNSKNWIPTGRLE